MLDVKVVNLTNRHNINFGSSKPNNDSVSGKQIAGLTLAAGGAGYALKAIKVPTNLTDNVVLEMHKETLKNEQKKLNIVSSIIGQIEKEKTTTLTPNQKDLLIGILGPDKMPQKDDNVLEVLKKAKTELQSELDAKTPKVIKKKIKLLETFIKKSEIVVDNATNANQTSTQKLTNAVKKNNEKGLDSLVKKIAELFHMEIDKTTGMPKEKITVETAKKFLEKTKDESKQLSKMFTQLRPNAEEQIKNAKFIPEGNKVLKKAWLKAKGTSFGKFVCALGLPLAVAYTLFGDKINDFLSK